MVKGTDEAILIVDDEENILAAMRRLFRPDGYQVFTAGGADEGLRVLRDHPIGLVISDKAMPGVDGIEFLRQVRAGWPDTVRIMLTGCADLASVMGAINQGEVYRFVTKPWDSQELRLVVRQGLDQYGLVQDNRRMQALIQEQNGMLKGWNESLKLAVEQRTEELRRSNTELERLHQQLKGSLLNSIRVLAGFIDLRDPAFGGHAKRVTLLSQSLCRRMGMPEELTTNVEVAALLHDIGKIGLPDEILRRQERQLSMRERALLRGHPSAGQAILDSIDSLEAVGLMIRHHHERWDGGGYPDGLRTEAIPIGSRVIALADAYDHHQQARFREPRANVAASFVASQLEMGPDGIFDPALVTALRRVLLESSEAGGSRDVALNVLEMREGMIVSRDVKTGTGALIVPRGEPMKQPLLGKLALLVRQGLIGPTVYVQI